MRDCPECALTMEPRRCNACNDDPIAGLLAQIEALRVASQALVDALNRPDSIGYARDELLALEAALKAVGS